jgi:hypothetical protein
MPDPHQQHADGKSDHQSTHLDFQRLLRFHGALIGILALGLKSFWINPVAASCWLSREINLF